MAQRFCFVSCLNCRGKLAHNFFSLQLRFRKKSLFLVINMAFADLMFGALHLPYQYLPIRRGTLSVMDSTLANVFVQFIDDHPRHFLTDLINFCGLDIR